MIDGRRRSAAGARGSGAPSGDLPYARPTGSSQTLDERQAKGSWRHLGAKLGALGVPADAVTIAGLVLACMTAVVIGLGYLYVGVALLTVGGLMDFLDGAVAKAAGTASARGAFFDSVADRVADALVLGGVTWYLAASRDPKLALLPFAILAVSTVVSYERAKAESLGFDARGGLMERAERLILLGIGLFFHVVLVEILWLLLVLTAGTALGRFARVWRQAGGARVPEDRWRVRAWRPARVESRWRAWRETGRLGENGPLVRRRAGGRTTRREERVQRRVAGSPGWAARRASRHESGRGGAARPARRRLLADR